MNNKLRIVWLIALTLTVANVVFILFFTFHISHHKSSSCSHKKDTIACLMHHELDLDKQQKILYDSIKNSYRIKAEIYIDSLHVLRQNLMAELNYETTDSSKLNETILLINNSNQIIFKQLIEQYISIKQILNIHQKEKLCAIYCDIFGCSNPAHCHMQNSQQENNLEKGCCSVKN